MTAARTILHVDMDAFYVSVELLRHPELRGQPVVVGGTGGRGVVAAASYEARAYGIHSALPSSRARRLCPHAVFLPGDHGLYAEVSVRVMELFKSFTPLVEPLSLDEAFLDVTGARRTAGSGEDIAAAIRAGVLEREGLVCSVGVAPSKFLAKLASQAAKPRAGRPGQPPRPGPGVFVVRPGSELAFLHPLPVSALWGVGPATLAKLQGIGVATVGDVARLPEAAMVARLGDAAGRHLHQLSLAIDDRPVVPDQVPKSVGHEETYPHDLHERDDLDRELVRLADATARRLRRASLAGRTITLKVRFGDFRTITRSSTRPAAVDSARAIGRVARALLDEIDVSGGVRLLGVSVTRFEPPGGHQLTLEPDDDDAWSEAEAAVDRIRDRDGSSALGPAVLAGPDGLGVKRRGAQQWGPQDAS